MRDFGSISRLQLSEHGNWRHIHQGALEAAYGKSPFFEYIFPRLKALYAEDEKDLAKFNEKMHEIILSLLWPENLAEKDLLDCMGPRILERGEEIKGSINPELSVLDAVMRMGPEAFPGLLTIT